jgi:hypothetical protein
MTDYSRPQPDNKSVPRGLRLCNPGNIRLGDPWQGLAEDQTDPSFCVFMSPEYGIRAAAKIILTYQDRYGCWSVKSIIDRWAPPNENDTGAYIAAVAKDVGVGPDELVDAHSLPVMTKLLRAIFVHENGSCPYDDALIEKGATMAGVR